MQRIFATLALVLGLAAYANADTTIANSGSAANAAAGAGAVAAPEQTVTLPTSPADTTAKLRNVPALGGMGGYAYAAPAGPCLGPSETYSGGIQAVWPFAGAGIQGGKGQSNLDWGCVIARELTIASTLCAAKVQKACDDAGKLYELLPGVSAIRAGSMPEYARAQVVPAPAPAAQPAQPAQQPQRQAIQQPIYCTSDPYIATRTGQALCK